MLQQIAQGVRVPDPDQVPRFTAHETELSAEELEAWLPLRDELLKLGALEPATSLEHCAAAFIIPKMRAGQRTGKWRLIVDERPINVYDQEEKSCSYQDLRSIHQDLKRDAFLASCDLEHGYYAIGIHPEDRKFFTFKLGGEAYQFTCLPFGWSLSPRIFNDTMAELARILRRRVANRCVRIRNYLDDWLFVFWRMTERAAQRTSDRLRRLLLEFGLRINEAKSTWAVCRQLAHLGLIIDTARMELRVPADKLQRLRAVAKALLSEVSRRSRWVLKRQAAQFAGFAQSLAPAVSPARFYLRSLYDDIASVSGSWYGKVRLSHQTVKDIKWWAALPAKWNGRAVVGPVPTVTLTTDASKLAWGACLDTSDGELWAHGHWGPEQRDLHISTLETVALLNAVRAYRKQLRNQVCRARIDNEVTRYITTSFTTAVGELMSVLRQLFYLCDTYNISLLPERVPTDLNKADGISRFHDLEEWVLQSWVWKQVQANFGPHTVDRFASANAHQLQRYNSRFYDPFAEEVNAFAVKRSSWAAENNFCNPPFSQLPNLVGLLELMVDDGLRVQATVVAPRWERAPWFYNLAALATDCFVVPAGDHAFSSSLTGRSFPLRWDLCVFRIDR